VKRIVGLNVTEKQVERAKERVKARGADDRIDLRLGSATEVPFPDGSFDKITALECAHHFDSREKFFHEAFRVLRPGGTLATADGLPSPGDPPLTFVNRIALRRWCVPLVNMYDRDEYKRRLEAIGFVNVKTESIRNYVFPGITKYHALRNKGLTIDSAVIELGEEEMQRCEGIDFMEVTGITDYVIVSADKPA
jgi:microcystin synthetase protein McyJ